MLMAKRYARRKLAAASVATTAYAARQQTAHSIPYGRVVYYLIGTLQTAYAIFFCLPTQENDGYPSPARDHPQPCRPQFHAPFAGSRLHSECREQEPRRGFGERLPSRAPYPTAAKTRLSPLMTTSHSELWCVIDREPAVPALRRPRPPIVLTARLSPPPAFRTRPV
jgi:hypothetical protein